MLTREEPCFANCEYCVTCIPLHETPIYAQLKADREGRGRYSVGGWIKPDAVHRMVYVPAETKPLVEDEYGTAWVKVLPDMSKFREQRKPLAKKGRKK
ncbi:hypothetical protein ACIGB6_10105 [Paeniglutamicibacter gangotriensis]|uniref:hypothetical protein n=1 Tax=Paeniglutamicibacter gangotriensis TaxID=254787 RepID=UPI0037CCAEB9